MQWFRLYDDLLDDPKCQQLPPALFKHWVNLLCLANKETPRGTLPNINAIAFRLRLSEAKTRAIINDLRAARLIDGDDETLRPHNWDERQKRSDNVADRVAKHRSNVTRNVTDLLPETGMKQDGNVLDTDTDTDTEQNREELDPPVGPPSGDKPKPQRSIKTPIPDNLGDLIPAEVWSTIGSEQGMSDDDLRFETENMLDHFRGNGERKIDWVATWRKWMRSPLRKPRGSPQPLRPQLPDGVTWNDIAEWRNRKHAGFPISDEQRRLLEIVDGRAAA